MKSGEEAPMPAAVNGEAAAPEPGTASEAAVVVMAPEPAAMREVEPVEEDKAPQPGPVIEAATATEDAPQQQGAEVVSKSRPAGIDGVKSPTSPAPLSPSQVKERQISVDPASLRRLGMVADEDSPLSAPSVFTEVVVQSPLLPPLRRPTFVGASLPCSAASSPVHGTGANRWEDNQTTPSPRSALSSLARQHSAALARLVVAAPPAALSRSASRAEGRTMAPHDDEEEEEEEEHVKALASEEGFTCGALCMLIPGFSSRKKPAAAAVSNIQRQHSGGKPRRSVASRVASLERFECGSWSPPPPPMSQHTAAVARHSSDCHEVAKISCDAVDDTESPVKMAFVFDGGEAPTPRGILKNSASASARMSSSARPSTSSQRHVRFSTAGAGAAESCPSSPSGVVTPRLARARAEFNAFLEAQSAA
ncbi:hypothetical protein PR202_ga15100 [Eleusine coracana subsp. coracana]|uniref:Uncharacterized protein n=1 Tax=Eleusine coracana subsp. coracana TaxID=191504 RepID=A0AAV5CI79_ELECO|nr:hypothetical protein PR202_ga15100 [Eleusine coracana subsp. coracana]